MRKEQNIGMIIKDLQGRERKRERNGRWGEMHLVKLGETERLMATKQYFILLGRKSKTRIGWGD